MCFAGSPGRVALTPSFNLTASTGRTWAEVSLVDVRGGNGLGFHRLSFDFKLHIDGADQTTAERLIMLFADVTVGAKPLGRATAVPYQLPIRVVAWSTASQVALEMDLERSRLEAVEAVRNGGDLQVNLMVYTTLEGPNGDTRLQSQQMSHSINQGVWVHILDAMDYQKRMLLEVPVPDAPASPDLKDAINLLARAQDSLVSGDYRDAVGGCRDVIERIDNALKADIDKATFENLREKTKVERLKLILRALKAFTHPARHSDDASTAMEWSRLDAAFVVSTVAALITELSALQVR